MIGKCEDCRWWFMNFHGEFAQCKRIPTADPLDDPKDQPVPGLYTGSSSRSVFFLLTPPDFGCTLFEVEGDA